MISPASPRKLQIFQIRFVLLSALVHLIPLVGLPIIFDDPEEVAQRRPPEPLAVSLVEVDSAPTGRGLAERATGLAASAQEDRDPTGTEATARSADRATDVRVVQVTIQTASSAAQTDDPPVPMTSATNKVLEAEDPTKRLLVAARIPRPEAATVEPLHGALETLVSRWPQQRRPVVEVSAEAVARVSSMKAPAPEERARRALPDGAHQLPDPRNRFTRAGVQQARERSMDPEGELRRWERLRQRATVQHVELAAPKRERPVQVLVEAVRISRQPTGERGEASTAETLAHARSGSPLPERDVSEIAQKVAKVLPLIYWEWERRGEITGRTAVRFRLDDDGYVESSRIMRSNGVAGLGRESNAALLMASPYRHVSGWIELSLTFRG